VEDSGKSAKHFAPECNETTNAAPNEKERGKKRKASDAVAEE
jgi:hypothetical protein